MPCSPAREETAETTGWAAVEIVEDMNLPQKVEASSGCLNIWIGAARIEVRPGFDPSLLFQVLRVVVGGC